MMNMGDMMERCIDAMGSLMGGGMMGYSFLLVILVALLLIWLAGLVAVGALVFWVARKFREQSGGP